MGDDFIISTPTYDKIEKAGGTRYKLARRPELYKDIIGQDHKSEQRVIWVNQETEPL